MRLRKNWLEWSVFAIGAAIVIASVAILIASAMRTGTLPPELVVEIGGAENESGRYRVPIVVRNRGDQTAAEVSFAIEMRKEGTVVERADMVLAFVPRRSEREASVVFVRDPGCCELVVSAIAFENP